MTFVLVKCSSYDPDNGYREWYEIQKQYNDNEICINLENLQNGYKYGRSD